MSDPNHLRTEITTKRPQSTRSYLKRSWRRVSEGLGVALYTIALILVVMAGWGAGINVLRSGWNSDAAAWVQAAGSIAAIVGATWIAQSETRRLRRARREHNEEAAWHVRFAIKQAQYDSHIIAAELVNRTSPIDEVDVREWRQRAVTSSIELNAFVSRIDHVHPAVTHVVSNAKVLIDELVNDLAYLNRILQEHKQPELVLINRIVAPHRALHELIELYDARMRGVKLALDEGDDALPIKTWAPWNLDCKESIKND